MSVLSPDKGCANVEDIVFLYRYAHVALLPDSKLKSTTAGQCAFFLVSLLFDPTDLKQIVF